MISVNFFLFLSLLFAVFILFLAFKNLLRTVLRLRRKKIITDTVKLQKDLKFLQLERKKAYFNYLLEQSKYEHWKEQAKSSYLMCYEHRKSIYEAYLKEERQKKFLISITKAKEQNILLLDHSILLIKNKIKQQNIDFKINFVELIKKI